MGCDKTLTAKDRIVQCHEKECFGAYFGLRAEGKDGLPSLAIYKSDHLDVDEKRNELRIFRQTETKDVVFAHSLTTGCYKGFSLLQVERAKYAILAGRRTDVHFLTNGDRFPPDIRRGIEDANRELEEGECQGRLSFHTVPKSTYARHVPSLSNRH